MVSFIESIDINQLKIGLQLLVAALLGGAIGLEREYWKKAAGLRTHMLVALGSCLFTILSREAFNDFIGKTSYDPSRIAANIVLGIGFIGAGVIMHAKGRVKGITTAAGIWIAAAIGMAVGSHFYTIALFTTLIVVVILFVARGYERRFREFVKKNNNKKKEGLNSAA